MSLTTEQRRRNARKSLAGLSVGDAFGERFFTHPGVAIQLIASRAVPAPPWGYTDDTVMAQSIVDVLVQRSRIDRDLLAELFGARYVLDPRRGYGGTAHEILNRIALGEPWREVACSVFGGRGSMGNGGAMRAAPIGAYFADDPRAATDAARHSAEVTHAHPEGQAGAIAVAIAAAWAASDGQDARDLFETVLAHTPAGTTRAGIECAARLSLDVEPAVAGAKLGNGSQVIAEDTVPFCIWLVARHLGQFEEAMWATVSALGDRDTTCAIVGGIVALEPGATIPPEWLAAREPLAHVARSLLPERFRDPASGT
ncbi:MAG: ADP-ribosylglycohydrolase family protein [Myxococcota bacterium]